MFLSVSNIFWPKDIFFQNLSDSCLLGANMMLLSVSNNLYQSFNSFEFSLIMMKCDVFERFKHFLTERYIFSKSFRFMFIRRNYDAFRQKKYFFQNLSESGLLGTNMMLLSVSNSFRQKNIFFKIFQNQVY